MQLLAKALKMARVGDLAVRRNPLFYADVERQLAAIESADLAMRRAWTNQRLSEVLWSARRTPYARRVHGGIELNTWPLLDRTQVQAAPGEFRSGSRLMSVHASTGGSSGAPLQLVRSLRSVVVEQVCIDRMMRTLGADAKRARVAVLRGDSIKDPDDFQPPFWTYAAGRQRLLLSAFHLNLATTPAYAKTLGEFRPDVLWVYPSALESLCLQLERAGEGLQLPCVLSSSEVLDPRVWDMAVRTLGCSLLDYYGQAERVAFAYAVRPGEYRFLPGYALVEFERVGEEGDQNVYEIIGTSLWNLSMPLVRYRTGDLIRLPAHWGTAELEELAFGMRTFSGVLGRETDFLLSPEGVRLIGINHFPRDLDNVVRIQVIQERVDHVRILVLAKQGYSRRDEERLMQNVRLKTPANMHVEIHCTDVLERTSAGKTPLVIHRPAIKQLLREGRARESAG